MSTLEPAPIKINRNTLFAASPPECLRSEHTLATAVLAAFSALILMVTGGIALSDWQSRQSALRADAEVLELRGSKTVRAFVRFVDADGVERTADATGPFNDIQASVGQRIPILYWPGSTSSVRHDDPSRNWIGVVLFASFGCLPLLPIPFMWRQVRRQEQRYARLRQRGLKRPVDAVRIERVPWGKFSRWAVVATWRDSLGRPYQTLAGPFSSEPAPLDPATLVVLSDPHAPEQSVVAPETLPAFSSWGHLRRPTKPVGTAA